MTQIRRTQQNSLHSKYPFLLEFTEKDFKLYEDMKGSKHNKMKPDHMIKRAIYICQPFDPPDCIMKMIDLREKDQYGHLKVWQGLVSRFGGYKQKRKSLNEDPDKFWKSMVGGAFSRKKISDEWQVTNGKQLALEHIKNLWNEQQGLCAISGYNMQLKVGSTDDWNYKRASLDRIDSSLPYGPNNVQLVCSFANQMKLDLSMRQFRKFIKDIALYNKMIKE
jgi:hypothetical protein